MKPKMFVDRMTELEQRVKIAEEAINTFWFDQYERMSVWHRRLAEKMEKRLSEIETLTITSQQENHGLTLRIRELEGSQPEATPCKICHGKPPFDHTIKCPTPEAKVFWATMGIIVKDGNDNPMCGQHEIVEKKALAILDAVGQPEAKPNPDGLDYLRKAYKDNHPARSALEAKNG